VGVGKKGDMRVHSKSKRGLDPAINSANKPTFNSVFNSLDAGILIIDSEGYFIEVNDSYCRMIQYERRELIGKHIMTVVPEMQKSVVMRLFSDDLFANATRKVTEIPIQRKDGHIFSASCSATVINEPNGARYMTVCITDNSEISKYKHLLEEAELAAGIGGWQLDVQNNSLSCTEGMYKLLELPKSKAITWYDLLTFVGKEAYQQFKWAVHQAIKKGTPFNIDLDCCTDTFHKKWIRAIGWPELALNKTIQLFGTFQDITQHKQAEQMIYLNQEKYRAIANSSLYAFILGKPDGTILEANTKACELFGYMPEEFKKLTRHDLVLHTKEFLKFMEERAKKGFVQGEQISIKKNGEHFPSEFSSVAFKDLNGEDRVSTIIRDITAKKKTEEELKKLSHVARETLCPIVLTDVERRIQWVNDAFVRIMEYTLEEVVGRRPEDFLYGEETGRENIKKMIENKNAGRTFEVEMLTYSKSGRKIWLDMQAQPQFDNEGNITGYFAIGIDSTERRNSEEKMLRNQRLLQQAERIASLGSWETDLKTGVTIWSDELFRIFGLKPNGPAPTMKQRLAIVHPYDLEYVLAAMRNVIDGKREFDLEFRSILPNGSIRIIHSQGQVIKNQRGEPEKLIGVVHDITSQKQAEERLRQQEARMLEEKVNHQRQIARATINTQEKERSEIGKELHDNVNQILASAKLFLSSPFIEGDEREQFIDKATEHIHTAIEEIRKLSKSLVSPSAEDLGIIETIDDMIADIRWAQKMEVCFNHAGIDESKLDYGLKLTLYRIVQEQMNNILKYAAATKIGITIKEQGKKLILTITDNGKGFDMAKKRKGIGLSNIINRADVFNGKVQIQTAPGNGCVLKVIFDKNQGPGSEFLVL
jgi:PAS domain S-box-containing protein